MHYLFIDCSSGLTIGLLDQKLEWLDFQTLDHKKPSEIIHQQLHFLIEKYQLRLNEVQCFCASGPGSYTGMRLSEGLVQLLELSGMKIYSFHHFNIPKLIGIEKGYWVTPAFKGEIFVYNWNLNQEEKILVKQNEIKFQDKSLGYTLENSNEFFSGLVSTKFLIKNEPQKLFTSVMDKKLRVKPFYFRTLEEEFR